MSSSRTALVLGGGGVTGIAWLLGVLTGLADAGADVTGAGTVIGTSAGAAVGARITASGGLRPRLRRPVRALRREPVPPAPGPVGATGPRAHAPWAPRAEA